MTRPTSYCRLCRNAPVAPVRAERIVQDGQEVLRLSGGAPHSLCEKCDSQVRHGWLAAAYEHFREAQERFGRGCCFGLNYAFGRDEAPDAREHGHIYLHPKGWEGSYRQVGVEFGVSFHDDHARTYFLRDFGDVADSEEYGEHIAYLDPQFWAKLEAQADSAPKAAWESGLSNCGACGYHTFDRCECMDEEQCDECGLPIDHCTCGEE